jgi:predicted AAA+ superfamily ATPase
MAADTAGEPRPLFYWRNEKTGTEVDFLIENEAVIPLEVKSGVNARSKSLTSYGRQFSPPQVARASLLNLKADGDTINIPLYLLPALRRVLQRRW